MLSVCLCSWNDLEFLKILHKGLQRNTRIPYELIVHDNGSEDGTEKWLKENKIKYSRSKENLGAASVNEAVAQSKYSHIVDINSDMYPLPGWDLEILKQIRNYKSEGVDKYTISSCLIEPRVSNPEYTISNHGVTPSSFDEEGLLQAFLTEKSFWIKPDTIQYSHPISMPKTLWDEMGGVDTDYPLGFSTDHDIPARAYAVGCRNFVMLGNSRLYHFISGTNNKLPKKPNGDSTFLSKWGITVEEFRKRMNIATPYKRVPEGVLDG
jgi:glycosyltransferase involved in cell wall biosynthesis